MCYINKLALCFIGSKLCYNGYERTLNSDDSEMSTLNSNISTFLIFPKAFPLTQLDSQILQSGSYYI